MNTLVSVVIPCYNVEKYIAECIDSVLKQSYEPIEIICVDNNSTDQTFQILTNYKFNNPDKISLEKEYLPGAPNARNKGLAMAQGEWIQFLDADDLLEEDKISSQMKLISAENNFIVGNYKTKSIQNSYSITTFDTDIWNGLINNKLGITSSNLFKKSALIEIDGWKKNLKSSQEYDLMFRLLQKNINVAYDNSISTIIRERESDSISKKDIPGNINRLINLLLEIRSYFSSLASQFDKENEIVNQAIFDKIRELSNIDMYKAITIYKLELTKKFRPKKNSSTGIIYLIMYYTLGFIMAEKIRKAIRKK